MSSAGVRWGRSRDRAALDTSIGTFARTCRRLRRNGRTNRGCRCDEKRTDEYTPRTFGDRLGQLRDHIFIWLCLHVIGERSCR